MHPSHSRGWLGEGRHHRYPTEEQLLLATSAGQERQDGQARLHQALDHLLEVWWPTAGADPPAAGARAVAGEP
jgi:hypothetical protein